MAFEISAKEANKILNKIFLLDVRTKEERDIAKIEPSQLIPVDELEKRYSELDKNKEIVVYCHHGVRSALAAEFLRKKGFNAKSLSGGTDKWSEEVDKDVPQY